MKIKTIFEFNLVQKIKEKRVEKQTNAEGVEIEVLVPHEVEKIRKFAIKKPNRKLTEDGDLFFAVEVSRFLKHGVLPYAKRTKVLEEADGPFSEKRAQEMKSYRESYLKNFNEYQSIVSIPEKERTPEQEERKTVVASELVDLESKIILWESQIEATFSQSAEGLARSRLWYWYLLQLAYENVNGEYKPFFIGETLEDKMDSYEALEEGDGTDNGEFEKTVVTKFIKLIVFWHKNKSNGQKTEDAEFQRILNL